MWRVVESSVELRLVIRFFDRDRSSKLHARVVYCPRFVGIGWRFAGRDARIVSRSRNCRSPKAFD